MLVETAQALLLVRSADLQDADGELGKCLEDVGPDDLRRLAGIAILEIPEDQPFGFLFRKIICRQERDQLLGFVQNTSNFLDEQPIF